ncbi:hypothetical protein ACFPYJ_18845 [Paenibacillus solisilvae]|uniref:Alpha-L-arabinofuranosidase C-terminal domain-containing protein n=1 Tax=Paenibacillus solisilvae TaxID=2486751 RepID=A0ABW0W270_9BACL
MKAKKHSGSKGFIFFGRKDDGNQLLWEAGGWKNQDSMIHAHVNGRNSVLTQRLFTVEIGVEYELALEVEGRRIRVFIDGELISETEDILVQGREVSAGIVFADMEKRQLEVEAFGVSGYALHDENSFETPDRIKPETKRMHTKDSENDYLFPKHSITVLRVK